jgi:transcriptional regulator of arginine metabolism
MPRPRPRSAPPLPALPASAGRLPATGNAPKSRRAALLQLLQSGQASTQSELCTLLAQRGLPTTQSTVSRDLKLLGAQRRLREDGDFVYVLSPTGPNAFPSDMVVDVDQNEHLIVVRTRIGRAQAVGFELDALRHPDLLGTLAGDDTVLVIPRTAARTAALAQHIRHLANLPDPD